MTALTAGFRSHIDSKVCDLNNLVTRSDEKSNGRTIDNSNLQNRIINSSERIKVKGKFLFLGTEKFYIKGVTYGTFAPREDGSQYPSEEIVKSDFRMIRQHGFNAVRTYTVPPQYLLNLAAENKLKVMVGLPWEQHITFLENRSTANDILRRVKEGVQECKQHPAILCYTIGNEIPAPIVRWYGKERVERFLKRLYQTVKKVDPKGLVTYVNYPTTEYLNLEFLDFDCFNVYLESPEKLSKYISRLHNLAGDRALVLAEIGLDSLRNGGEKQSEVLKWQIETIFGKGCAGMFVFAWTDEWWRGGFEIEDWDFGLVNRGRVPKPSLSTVNQAMKCIPLPADLAMPFFSVIVCTYNGSATIRDTLDRLKKLQYPNFEVIVVNDGSTDKTAQIIEEYDVRLINTTNRGLSSARNTGMNSAKGEIIAYIDDDAYPDQHWLHYLAYAYRTSEYAAIGGPNIVPDDDRAIAICVANAPGGPVHVLATDEIAEHIPGCNFSVRRDILLQIGGFDPVFRSAGDDVDVCWRIQQAGYTIGFHPSAMVWHHRRNSLKAYWRQQQGYGKAEALLEAKWPEKYNGFGHLTWSGRIYGNGFTVPIDVKKGKVFHGVWGSALFQSVYQPAEGFFKYLPLMPEWYLLSALFGIVACLGFLWTPLLIFWLVFFASIAIIILQGLISAHKNTSLSKEQQKNWRFFCLILVLHVMQPFPRLWGRLTQGLTPWRIRGRIQPSLKNITFFSSKTLTLWSENEWKASEAWLSEIEQNIIKLKARVKRGGDFDKWDIIIRTGLFNTAKAVIAVEDHGAKKQFIKFKYRTEYSPGGLLLILFLALTTAFAVNDQSWVVALMLFALTICVIAKYVIDLSSVVNCLVKGFIHLSEDIDRENEFRKLQQTKALQTKVARLFPEDARELSIPRYMQSNYKQRKS